MRIFLTIFALVGCGFASQLPNSFKRCPVSPATDNRPDECLRSAVEAAIRDLGASDGNADLGLGDLDPFHIGFLSVSQPDGPLALSLNLTDGTVEGLGKIKVVSVEGKVSSAKDFSIAIKYVCDKIIIRGNYSVNGRVLILPITGQGISKQTMTDYHGIITITAQPKMKNGKEYLKLTSFSLKYDVLDKSVMELQNLFGGNKELGDIMNKFLTDNWRELDNYAKPTTLKLFSAAYAKYAKRLLEKVAYDDIFLRE